MNILVTGAAGFIGSRYVRGRGLGYRPHRDFATGLAEAVARYRDHRAWWEPLERCTDAD
ncbi:hypothetical protein [Streptomyces sp. NPDC060275]|uniref:hypothetical protein n=1 Tax=Streptomyces sp. NPDC060275 TaxID=3347090 RepID=UPI00365D7F31